MPTTPKAHKFHLVYRKDNGQLKSYSLSLPIEENTETFTAYAFGHGIRSFKRKNVVKFNQLY